MMSLPMEFTVATPSSRVRLSQRASDEVASLSSTDYLRYEDALVELSVQLALGEAPCERGYEHVLEYEGCTLLYRPDSDSENVLVNRVVCARTLHPAVEEDFSFALA